MKPIAYACLLIAGAVGGCAFAVWGARGGNVRLGLMICVPIGLVIGGACAAFVAWLSKESRE
jgi:uncharacterized protein YqgC (DUF456 family)